MQHLVLFDVGNNRVRLMVKIRNWVMVGQNWAYVLDIIRLKRVPKLDQNFQTERKLINTRNRNRNGISEMGEN